MIVCPICHRTDRQYEARKTYSGVNAIAVCSARLNILQTPNLGYPKEVRRKALQLYVDGVNLRRIARPLGHHHRTVSLSVQAQADKLPDPPVPSEVKEAEMDELLTFIRDNKTKSSSSSS
jgi:transposase-like protein